MMLGNGRLVVGADRTVLFDVGLDDCVKGVGMSVVDDVVSAGVAVADVVSGADSVRNERS